MILGIGVDLVAFDEMRALLERRGEALLARVFTDAELTFCRRAPDPVRAFAARFAAKEAALKALRTGWAGGVEWRDVEVLEPHSARFDLRLEGEAARRAPGAVLRLTIACDDRRATAFVIALAGPA